MNLHVKSPASANYPKSKIILLKRNELYKNSSCVENIKNMIYDFHLNLDKLLLGFDRS